MGDPAQKTDDRLDHGDFTVVEFPGFRRIQGAEVFQLGENPSPAEFQPHLDVRIEVVVASDSADDVVTVEDRLQFIEGIRRIPRVWIGGIPGHAAKADQEEEAAPHKGVERIDIEGVFRQEPGEVFGPAGVAVKVTVRMVGGDLKPEVVGRHDPSVVVLVQSALFFDFFRGLRQFAFAEQPQPFGVIECFRFRILVDVLNHR